LLGGHISSLIEYQEADMATRHPKGVAEAKRETLRRMKSLLIAFRGRLDEELKPMGVTTAQMQMLNAVREHPGASGAQLARACRVTPQTAHGFLARAEREAWIVRGKDAENGRLVLRSLTGAGLTLLEQADRLSRTIEARVWRGTDAGELRMINEVLARCMEHLEG